MSNLLEILGSLLAQLFVSHNLFLLLLAPLSASQTVRNGEA